MVVLAAAFACHPVQVVLACVVALGAGVFLRTNKTCLPDDGNPLAFSHKHLCTFTFITGGLTIPICAVVLVIEVSMQYSWQKNPPPLHLSSNCNSGSESAETSVAACSVRSAVATEPGHPH